MAKNKVASATPTTDSQALAIAAGSPVRISSTAKLSVWSDELDPVAGREGTLLQLLPSGEMAQIEVDGETHVVRVGDFIALTVMTGDIDFRQESPALVVHSLTNPRRRRGLGIDSLNALAANIKVLGVMQPILVRKLPAARMEDTAHLTPRPVYEVIAGERRWRAATLAGLAKIPMLVRELDDHAVMEMQLAENIEREDLDDMEEAEGFEMMRTELGMTVEQIAARVGKGKGESYILKALKLCALTPASREAMYDGTLGRSTGLLVARYPAEDQAEVIDFIRSLAVDGEPAPFRTVGRALFKRFNLTLASAVFDITDENLVIGCPSCTACPKRSGNQGDIFGDNGAEDSCTDAPCFDFKRTAHMKRVAEQAAKDGFKVIDGQEAAKAKPSPHGRVILGYVRLDDVARQEQGDDGTVRDVTFADALASMGRKAPKARVFIDPHTGESSKVITAELAEKLTPRDDEPAATKPSKAKPAERPAAAPIPSTTPEQDALELPGVERAMFVRLFDAIRTRDASTQPAERQAAELADVVAAIFGYGDSIPHVEEYLGWAGELADCDEGDHAALVLEKVVQLPVGQLAQIIVMAALERRLTHYLVKTDEALAVFQGYGVDVLAVRDKVAEDLQRQDAQEEVEA